MFVNANLESLCRVSFWRKSQTVILRVGLTTIKGLLALYNYHSMARKAKRDHFICLLNAKVNIIDDEH